MEGLVNEDEIRLIFRFGDFDEAGGKVEDDHPCQAQVSVSRMDGGLFLVNEPTSLSPFGPHGPFLGLATIFRAKPLEGGAYRFAGIVEEPKRWTWTLPVSQPPSDDDVMTALEQLSSKGCLWEWCAGNLTIQRLADSAGSTLDDTNALIEVLKRAVSRSS